MRRALSIALASVALLAVAGGCSSWRVFFPSHAYDSEPPVVPSNLTRPAVLMFSKTNGFRHGEAIVAGVAMFERVAERRGWSLFHTENAAIFNARDLARFDVAVWHNVSGDVLDRDQRASLRAWLEAGGGWVGVHGSGGDPSYDWDWYVEELVAAQFVGHTMGPQFQDATLVVEQARHPATKQLPASWTHNEEWYSFEASPRLKTGVEVLIRVDESSYEPRQRIAWLDRDLAMVDHPIVWSRCIGRGRALFSALGHQAEAYASDEVRAILEGAVAWAARLEGEGCD